MTFKQSIQPQIIPIDENLRLRNPDKIEWKTALPWYQNPKVLLYSEGVTDKVYDMDIINRMYKYLNSIGELYFIEIFQGKIWKSIGDVTLAEKNMPIAIGYEEYWGRGIGKKVIGKLIERAKSIGLSKIYIPEIYLYNNRSQNLFISMGFIEVNKNNIEKSYELNLL
ncbi:GNAT family N-acetyltransferase [Clostridium sp. CS001]|uniref:GNAT family N-acetyltransferase n=1 Tax=Clostridium sp. CS001 TaxID=2880648 RepID=UPI001CF34A81|nr:GNAT family N-acetyltransferase [Clostridium sp. CS001]MCB2290545.1 GNAT family N-acetyltransferase [Clostridium sp. CS001]